MSTIVIGSRAWCDYWAKWHWDKACKEADRSCKPISAFSKEFLEIQAMYHMLESYRWEDEEPWA